MSAANHKVGQNVTVQCIAGISPQCTVTVTRFVATGNAMIQSCNPCLDQLADEFWAVYNEKSERT